MILDVDAREMEVEKQEAQGTYNQVQGYMPLLGHVDGVGVGHEFGEGKQSPGAGMLKLAPSGEATLPEGKRIYFRSDRAADQAEVVNHSRRPGRSFTVTADLDAAVKRESKPLRETVWTPYRTAEGIARDRQMAETVQSLNGTEPAFRLMVLRWPNPPPSLLEADRYGNQAVATNREERGREVIWKHKPRGQGEKGQKELKVGLGMEQMRCGQREAKALYFAIGC